MMVPPPPLSETASLDFEIYSEAGYSFNPEKKAWESSVKGKPGISAVGAFVYSIHPSTRIRSLAYDLHDGKGVRLWFPGLAFPEDLLAHARNGNLMEAHNSIFEFWIWNNVAVPQFGWPRLVMEQMTCTSARCAAAGLPRALGNVHKAIDLPVHKMEIGDKLIKEFCVPHSRKKSKYHIGQLHEYCGYDVMTEDALSIRIPDLNPIERQIWVMDQKINHRGVKIDVAAVRALARKVEQYVEQAGRRLAYYTNGEADSPRQVERIGTWLEGRGLKVPRTGKNNYKLDKEAVDDLMSQLQDPLSPEMEVLELRKQFSLASVDKIKTMGAMVGPDGRLRGLFWYHGAHTGRWTSMGVQLQNLARGSMHADDVRRILEEIKCDNWTSVEGKEPLAVISQLIRGLFIADDDRDFICADFSAIEGRGQAMLAGEQWRIDVFRGDGKIYEATAADIAKIDKEVLLAYKRETGKHHELRGVGKVGELASGYSGWINAWIRFGAGKYLPTREAIKQAILTWREKSPMIVEMWGGQVRKHPHKWKWKPELYGLEGAVVKAIQQPNTWFSYRTIAYRHDTQNDVLLCKLPSGRMLWYRQPRLTPSWNKWAELPVYLISYMSFSQQDGWHPKLTYGGRLFENVVQADCRDIMAWSMLRLEKRGYPIVLHVHDEPVAEVHKGYGSTDEMVDIMEETEDWYTEYPIAVGREEAWIGPDYRK